MTKEEFELVWEKAFQAGVDSEKAKHTNDHITIPTPVPYSPTTPYTPIQPDKLTVTTDFSKGVSCSTTNTTAEIKVSNDDASEIKTVSNSQFYVGQKVTGIVAEFTPEYKVLVMDFRCIYIDTNFAYFLGLVPIQENIDWLTANKCIFSILAFDQFKSDDIDGIIPSQEILRKAISTEVNGKGALKADIDIDIVGCDYWVKPEGYIGEDKVKVMDKDGYLNTKNLVSDEGIATTANLIPMCKITIN